MALWRTVGPIKEWSAFDRSICPPRTQYPTEIDWWYIIFGFFKY